MGDSDGEDCGELGSVGVARGGTAMVAFALACTSTAAAADIGANDDGGKFAPDAGALLYREMALIGMRETVITVRWLPSDPLGLDSRQVAALTRPDLSMVQALASLSSGYSWPSPYGDNDRDVYMNSSVYVAPPVASPYEASAPYPCSPLNCYGLNPYSPFNGFGAPFGFAVITTSPFRSHRGRDGKSFNHQFHDGHRPNGFKPWGGRSGGGRR